MGLTPTAKFSDTVFNSFITALSENVNLREVSLNVKNSELSITILEALSRLPSLTSLSFYPIDFVQMQSLEKFLEDSRTIQHLDLHGNGDDKGLQDFAARLNNKSLQSLSLIELSPHNLPAFASSLRSNRSLSEFYCEIDLDEDLDEETAFDFVKDLKSNTNLIKCSIDLDKKDINNFLQAIICRNRTLRFDNTPVALAILFQAHRTKHAFFGCEFVILKLLEFYPFLEIPPITATPEGRAAVRAIMKSDVPKEQFMTTFFRPGYSSQSALPDIEACQNVVQKRLDTEGVLSNSFSW